MNTLSKYDFKKEEIEYYLSELAKEIKNKYGNSVKFSLTIAGGAVFSLKNITDRNSTQDIDAISHQINELASLIEKVAEDKGIMPDWLNFSIMKSSSYSPVLESVSDFYSSYSNVLDIYTVKVEYIAAMKLKAHRTGSGKNDIGDITKLVIHENISFSNILNAYKNLYNKDVSFEELSLLRQAYKNIDKKNNIFISSNEFVEINKVDKTKDKNFVLSVIENLKNKIFENMR